MRFCVISLLMLISPALGQVNVEDQRLGRAESGFGGSLGLSLELKRGNSELTEIGFIPRLVFRAGPSQWFMLNDYSFVETDEASVVNQGFSHLRYNYDLSERIVVEGLTQVQYDRQQDLRRRFLLGGGFRFELLQRNTVSLSVGVIGMYEYEELEGDIVVETPRNSNYIAIRLRGADNLTLSNTLYVQPSVQDFSDVRVLNNLEASVALAKWLAITLETNYRYDSEPANGVKEYDLSLENGVKIRF